MDYEDWLKKGLKNMEKEIKPERPFELKKLFVGFGWEELSVGERISFGKYFSTAVNDGRIPNIKKVAKGKDNHTRYIKTAENVNTKK